MNTVAELLKRLTELKHREVIWGRVADFLHQFLSQDIGEPQQMTAEDCLIPNVPESEIEAVLEETIYSLLEEIEKEVTSLGDMKVGNERPKTKKRLSAAKSKSAADKSVVDDDSTAVRTPRKKRS